MFIAFSLILQFKDAKFMCVKLDKNILNQKNL